MIRLASGSPRRRQLLGLLGVPFAVVPADVDENASPHPAFAKALAVAERIGKPADAAGAVAMLHRLAGRPHTVRTEVALIGPNGRPLRFGVRTTVAMKPADDAAIRAYVATGEPLDRAGAYAIQGGGSELVAWYDGCYANVVGLPLCHVFFGLRKLGIGVPERPEPAFTRAFGFECPARRIAYADGRRLRDGTEYDTGSGRRS